MHWHQASSIMKHGDLFEGKMCMKNLHYCQGQFTVMHPMLLAVNACHQKTLICSVLVIDMQAAIVF